MQLYFIKEIHSGEIYLDSEESSHLIRVLRHRKGDIIRITDGKGTFTDAEIITADSRECCLSANSLQLAPLSFPNKLILAVAITRNSERFEWFAEKATEMGVSIICPMICDHSERKKMNEDRLQKVVKAAAKQSLRYHFPEVKPIMPMKQLTSVFAEIPGFIAVCNDLEAVSLKDIYVTGSDAVIYIGPEGDFSENEIDEAVNAKMRKITLGSYRLRTETAAIAACHTIHMINEIKGSK